MIIILTFCLLCCRTKSMHSASKSCHDDGYTSGMLARNHTINASCLAFCRGSAVLMAAMTSSLSSFLLVLCRRPPRLVGATTATWSSSSSTSLSSFLLVLCRRPPRLVGATTATSSSSSSSVVDPSPNSSGNF